jgi:excisionase family DNA binding protein
MSAGQRPESDRLGEGLLRPSEVAAIFGVRTATIARWARSGALPSVPTLGGHRRYRLADVQALFKEPGPEQKQLEEDATRLYQQGWDVRQVAEKFGYSYGAMRRILLKHTALRPRGGSRPEGEWPGDVE